MKTVLVTGGSRGIGKAIVEKFAKSDFNVILNYNKSFEAAKAVGAEIAKRCADKGITKVVFDRGGYVYHGRVQALADAAREAGLQF